jgi:hypothetical protein
VRGAHLLLPCAEVLREQLVAQRRDLARDAPLAARLDRHIELRVAAHRAVRESRRAESHQLVVHDHQLGVDVQARDARHHGMHDGEAPVPVGRGESPQHTGAQHAQGR